MKRKNSIIKPILSIVISILLFATFLPTAFAADIPAITASGNAVLYAIFHAAPYNLDTGPGSDGTITMNEMLTVTGPVDLSNKGITNLAGINYATNITSLDLSNNPDLKNVGYSPSLAPLANLTGLKSLKLCNDTGLTDISSINTLVNLDTLDLSGCVNITALPFTAANAHTFTKLKNLWIKGYTPQTTADTKGPPMPLKTIGNVSAIASLPRFAALDAANPATLVISNSDITDLSAFNSCGGLTTLIWGYSDAVTDANIIFPSAANLYYIDLGYDKNLGSGTLTKIAAVPSFHAHGSNPYATLCISATNIKNVSNLHTAAGLGTLYWQNIDTLTASDTDSVSGLTQIFNLDLVNDTALGNGVLADVAELSGITILGLGNCGLTDLSGISGMTGLTSLNIGSNKITSLAPLQNMANLQALIMNNNYVSDVSPLTGKPVSYIDCSQNYLDQTAGSTDMQVIDSLPGTNKYFNNQHQITVHFDPNQSGADAIADITRYYGQGFTTPAIASKDPSLEFNGWDANNLDGTASPDIAGGKTTAIAVDTAALAAAYDTLTFTAVYGTAHYTVDFNTSGGSAIPSQTLQYNEPAAKPADPTRAGYDFVNWYKDNAFANVWDFTADKITKNTTLYAKWAGHSYTLSFDAQGGSGTAPARTVINGNAYGALPEVSKAGSVFAGWYTQPNGGGSHITAASTVNITAGQMLYAYFKAVGTPSVAAASAGYNTVKLTWNAAANASGYEVYQSKSPSKDFAKIADTTGTICTASGLNCGTKYYFKVKAYLGAGSAKTYGAFSPTVSQTPVPATPVNVKAVKKSAKSVKISWGSVAGKSGYQVYQVTSGGTVKKTLKTTTSTSYTNTSLKKGKTYYYKVRAFKKVGTKNVYSGYSVSVHVKL